ncbi:MAG: NmrA family NAD(P)-binding protein [Deltaproteobacteria bacterium]|nr:NmrA family NAD(P)-binding protein [Deltaproteobacteria bacterium]
MILVTGPTGQTGHVAVDQLLSQKRPVRALVRNAEKAEALRARGAEVVVGSLEDPGMWEGALKGVKSVYFLAPPDPKATDLVGRGAKIVDHFVAALSKSTVEHVVLLSSVGAQHAAGNGPVKILNNAEQKIGATGKKLTALRASYFMENAAGMVGLMKAQGIVPCFFDPASKIPMVASADIGRVAAELLTDPPATSGIVELEGPVALSYEDVAAAFSTALGKTITAVPVPGPGIVPTLVQAGFSENVAGLYAEMSAGIANGVMVFSGGNARHVRGKITIAEIAKQFAA